MKEMERRKRGIGLELSEEEIERVSKLIVNPHNPHFDQSFCEDFSLRGIRLDRVEPGSVVCSFQVPPRLTDKHGNLAPGAIANIVDEIGALVIYKEDSPMSVSVCMSISYASTAKVDDELEVTSRLVGQRGFISGTVVVLKNKTTGETVAEGRHTLFSKPTSKI